MWRTKYFLEDGSDTYLQPATFPARFLKATRVAMWIVLSLFAAGFLQLIFLLAVKQ
jgi:hypothetical protein